MNLKKLTIQLTEVILSIVVPRPVCERLLTLVTKTGSSIKTQETHV